MIDHAIGGVLQRMSKYRVIALFLSLFISGLSLAAERLSVGVILGRPDASLSFIQKMVKESLSLDVEGNNYEINWTTQLLSILSKEGVDNILQVEAVSEFGSMSNDLMGKALQLASERSNIVFVPIGGSFENENEMCLYASKLTNSVFIFTAGMEGSFIDEGSIPACLSPNMIRVAALNRAHSDLLPHSNFGLAIQLAAPGEKIEVTGAGGVTGTISSAAAASAFVTGELSKFQMSHPILFGHALIEGFYFERTVSLPVLLGRIRDGRAVF
jgi:hypothetical protein